MPSVVIRVKRDKVWIGKLDDAMNAFIGEMLKCREELIERGLKI